MMTEYFESRFRILQLRGGEDGPLLIGEAGEIGARQKLSGLLGSDRFLLLRDGCSEASLVIERGCTRASRSA